MSRETWRALQVRDNTDVVLQRIRKMRRDTDAVLKSAPLMKASGFDLAHDNGTNGTNGRGGVEASVEASVEDEGEEGGGYGGGGGGGGGGVVSHGRHGHLHPADAVNECLRDYVNVLHTLAEESSAWISGSAFNGFFESVEGGVLAAAQEASTSMPLLKLEGK